IRAISDFHLGVKQEGGMEFEASFDVGPPSSRGKGKTLAAFDVFRGRSLTGRSVTAPSTWGRGRALLSANCLKFVSAAASCWNFSPSTMSPATGRVRVSA